MFSKFLPKDEQFFEMFIELARRATASARLPVSAGRAAGRHQHERNRFVRGVMPAPAQSPSPQGGALDILVAPSEANHLRAKSGILEQFRSFLQPRSGS